MAIKYGRTDPSAFQLRDLHRRVTKMEAAQERMQLRQTNHFSTVMKTMNDILSESAELDQALEELDCNDDLLEVKINVIAGRCDRIRQALANLGAPVD